MGLSFSRLSLDAGLDSLVPFAEYNNIGWYHQGGRPLFCNTVCDFSTHLEPPVAAREAKSFFALNACTSFSSCHPNLSALKTQHKGLYSAGRTRHHTAACHCQAFSAVCCWTEMSKRHESMEGDDLFWSSCKRAMLNCALCIISRQFAHMTQQHEGNPYMSFVTAALKGRGNFLIKTTLANVYRNHFIDYPKC